MEGPLDALDGRNFFYRNIGPETDFTDARGMYEDGRLP